MTLPVSRRRSVGDRRVLAGKAQVCMGPCRRCGQPVWRDVDRPVKDEPPIHKRICAELEANRA